jgi:hypothetical protein
MGWKRGGAVVGAGRVSQSARAARSVDGPPLALRMRLRISALEESSVGIFFSLLPPVAEGLLGHEVEVAGLGPTAEEAGHPS